MPNPRIAPTMNYGIVGTTVYSDIVQGLSGLMGQYNQGRRDIADAEFRQEGLEMQQDQFDFTQEQAGISNQLQRDKFNLDVTDSYFDNVIKATEAGLSTGAIPTPEGMELPQGVAQKGSQLASTIKSVDAIQTLMDNSGPGKFQQEYVDEYAISLRESLNPEGSNPDFDLIAGVIEGEKGMTLKVDQRTYDDLPEDYARIFSVIGEAPSEDPNAPGGSVVVTPTMMAGQLGREIGTLNDFGSKGIAAAARKHSRFKTSKATAPEANRIYLRGVAQKANVGASSRVDSAVARFDIMAKNLLSNAKQGSVGVTAVTKSEIASKAKVMAAYQTFQGSTKNVADVDQIAEAERVFYEDVLGTVSRFNEIADEAQLRVDFDSAVGVGEDGGAFDHTTHAKGLKTTKAQARTAFAEVAPTMTAAFTKEGMAPFIKAETDRLIAGGTPPGDALDQATTTFDQHLQFFNADLASASIKGSPINSRSMKFMSTYTKGMLGNLRSRNISSFLLPEADLATEMTNTY